MQQRIDHQYEKKLIEVGNAAMQQLKRQQQEHRAILSGSQFQTLPQQADSRIESRMDSRMDPRYSTPRLKSSYDPNQEPARSSTPNRSQSISFLAEQNPDLRQLYDEFKRAISAARDPYTREARLLDVLMNL